MYAGNLLIQRMWVFDGRDGQMVRACREDDEHLYAKLRSYDARMGEARRRYEAREAYLEGLSTGDFEPAFREFMGEQERERSCLLVVIGVREDGHKELLHSRSVDLTSPR